MGRSITSDPVCYDSVDQEMSFLMSNLPQLTWLEIAGTNLAGFVPQQTVLHRPTASTDR